MQSTFVPGSSLLHRLHPLTKLAAVALVLVASYALPWLFAPLALFALLAALAWQSDIAGRFVRTVARLLLPITLSLFIIQGLFFPGSGAPLITLGPLSVSGAGLTFAFRTSTRLLAFAGTLLLLLQTTHPADLVAALAERGLPQSIGYILLVSLQIVPDMSARATAILEAQRARGLETQGGLQRARALLPLVGPLIVGALVDVEERAMALESRAYTTSGAKTSLRVLHDSPPQRAARLLLALLLAALILWRIALLFWI